MNTRKRLERLEANHSAPYETPVSLELYFKTLENERRKHAREPPLPLTSEEESLEREMDSDPELRAYMKQISQQREERLWREET